MFSELENETWIPSAGTTVLENTDFKIKDKSNEILFVSGGDYVDVNFNSIDLSNYENFSIYIYTSPQLNEENLFKIYIGSEEFTYNGLNRNGFFHNVLIACDEMGEVSTFRIESLVDDLTIFIDYAGFSVVNYDIMDSDIIDSLEDHISLDYEVETTLASELKSGDTDIDLMSWNYIYTNTMIVINDIEMNQISGRGKLYDNALVTYPIGTPVKVLLPIVTDELNDLTPNPVIGITIIGMDNDIKTTVEGIRDRQYLGGITIQVFIESSSKQKLLRMIRQYQHKYKNGFTFLHDGQLVEIYLDDYIFIDSEIGNFPRASFIYKIKPSSIIISQKDTITDFTFNYKKG